MWTSKQRPLDSTTNNGHSRSNVLYYDDNSVRLINYNIILETRMNWDRYVCLTQFIYIYPPYPFIIYDIIIYIIQLKRTYLTYTDPISMSYAYA